jgi:uncharacterized protein (TIGR03435 family)
MNGTLTRIALTLGVSLMLSVVSTGQPPAFEVASVKPSQSGQAGTEVGRRPGGRLVAVNATAVRLLRYAYAVQDHQLVALPAWAGTERFDINAKMADEPPRLPGPDDPFLVATRALLAERFKLVAHRDTRELDAYALVKVRQDAKLGANLRTSAQDCPDALNKARLSGAPAVDASGAPLCGIREGEGGRLRAGGTSMSLFVSFLAARLGRAVLDRTDLNGYWNFELTYSDLPQGARPAAANAQPVDPNAPSLFTALQEQLGLKLEATRAPVEVVVIDRLERPTSD